MQDMRHLNLFGKITKVSTRFCFRYNEHVIFCVPEKLVSRAIGENGKNVRKINEIIGKRIKVIPSPKGIVDVKRFISAIVNPIIFQDLEVKGNEIIVTAGSRSKAALIGRNKRRLLELQKISKDYFNKDLKIV
tara:strand:- start:306 stop:704 length:399 start_codon:yes stop_codon:yes gene_type:complete